MKARLLFQLSKSHRLFGSATVKDETQKMLEKLKKSKQITLDNLPKAPLKKDNKTTAQFQEKQIIITEINTLTGEDELELKVGFKLIPSQNAFSKVNSDLWFDNQKINSRLIKIPQGPLSAKELELPRLVLDMKGIAAGSYKIKIEMYELWNNEEKLSFTKKETIVQYLPKIRMSRLIKIPTVKSFGGTDLAVVSESDKKIYRDIEETARKESTAKQDQW